MRTILILLVLVMFITACSSSTEFEEPEIVTGEDSLNEMNDSQDNETSETDDDEVDAKKELQAFFNMRPTYKAEYLVKSTVGGDEFSGIEVIAVKGENNMRQYANESLYIIGNEVYVCYDEGEMNCYNIPQEQPPEENEMIIPDEIQVETLPDRNIAGTTANCYRLIGEETSIDCRSDEGVLLYLLRSTNDYEIEYTAQSVSTKVGSDVFDLPADPKEYDPEVFE